MLEPAVARPRSATFPKTAFALPTKRQGRIISCLIIFTSAFRSPSPRFWPPHGGITMLKDSAATQHVQRLGRLKRAGLRGALLVTALGIAGFGPSFAQGNLPALPGKDWPIYNGSYNSQRFSTLKQVNAGNAHALQSKWTYHVSGSASLETVPVVANGVMYVSGFNRIDALDARTGNLIWKFQRQPA